MTIHPTGRPHRLFIGHSIHSFLHIWTTTVYESIKHYYILYNDNSSKFWNLFKKQKQTHTQRTRARTIIPLFIFIFIHTEKFHFQAFQKCQKWPFAIFDVYRERINITSGHTWMTYKPDWMIYWRMFILVTNCFGECSFMPNYGN